jgi:hypothetical protein
MPTYLVVEIRRSEAHSSGRRSVSVSRQTRTPSSMCLSPTPVPRTTTVSRWLAALPMPILITASGPATDEEATAQAQQLLDQFLKRLRELGAKAEGELGNPDPLQADPSSAAGAGV